jgi:hypothetical protein
MGGAERAGRRTDRGSPRSIQFRSRAGDVLAGLVIASPAAPDPLASLGAGFSAVPFPFRSSRGLHRSPWRSTLASGRPSAIHLRWFVDCFVTRARGFLPMNTSPNLFGLSSRGLHRSPWRSTLTGMLRCSAPASEHRVRRRHHASLAPPVRPLAMTNSYANPVPQPRGKRTAGCVFSVVERARWRFAPAHVAPPPSLRHGCGTGARRRRPPGPVRAAVLPRRAVHGGRSGRARRRRVRPPGRR